MEQLNTPDVVVLVPGILGSVLTHHGREVWSLSGSSLVRALFSLAGAARELALNGDDPSLDDLDDGVEAPRVIEGAHLVPGFWKIDGYAGVREFLFRCLALQEGVNYFEFPYDWRRDNRVAARKLKRRTDALLAARRKQLPGREVKLILVSHSMGGLVARYFLECLGGARDTRLAITFGTPFRGSVKALDYLCNGFQKIVDVSELLRSFTSLYQLLPTYRCVGGADGLQKIAEVETLPNLDRRRALAAAEFHREMNDAAEASPVSPYLLYTVVGTQQTTLQSAQLAGGRLTARSTYDSEDWNGDGTVPRISATPDDARANPRFYVAGHHGCLQNTQVVQANLGALLAERLASAAMGAAEAHQKRVDQLVRVRLQIPDAIVANEPLTIAARPEQERPLVASVERVGERGRLVVVPLTPGTDGVHRGSLLDVRQGCYRVTVFSSDAGVLPVHDVCAVA